MKNKTITFRHWRMVSFLDKELDQKARRDLIQDCLKRGYVPSQVKFDKKIDYSKIKPVEVRVWHCIAGFAGKKQARVIYEKNKKLLNTPPKQIRIL